MAVAFFLLRHFSQLALFAAAIYGWGRLAAGSLAFRDGLEEAAFSGALGTGVLASLLNLLGLAGALSPAAILALLIAPVALVLLRWKKLRPRPIVLERWELPAVLLLAAALLAGSALALYPPTGFDATLYHLPLARAFSRHHAIAFLPDLRFPVFPQLYEMLFAASLSISDDVAAQLTHFASVALTTAGLLAGGRRFATPRAGIWAAAAWLGSPLVLYVGSSAYVDSALALFGTFSLLAWLSWRESRDARWLTAAAAYAGFAAATKYLGLFLVAALPLATAATRPRAEGLKRALRFSAVALLALAPFYARIVRQTGNPVFPYFSRWFGASSWSQPHDPIGAPTLGAASDRSQLEARIERFRHPMALARVPWRLVTRGEGLGETPPFSPVLLLLIPLLAWGAAADPRVRPIAILTVVYGLAWYLFCPDRRYLLTVLPAALLAGAATLDALLRAIPGRPAGTRPGMAAAAVTLLLVAPGMAWTAATLGRRGPLPVAAASRDAYLSRFIPVYPALESLNRTRGSDYTAYGLFCENAAYFARGRFLGDHFGLHPYALVIRSLSDSRHLYATLRAMGVTHLIVQDVRRPASLPSDPEFPSLFHRLPSPEPTRLFVLEKQEPSAPVSSPPELHPTNP